MEESEGIDAIESAGQAHADCAEVCGEMCRSYAVWRIRCGRAHTTSSTDTMARMRRPTAGRTKASFKLENAQPQACHDHLHHAEPILRRDFIYHLYVFGDRKINKFHRYIIRIVITKIIFYLKELYRSSIDHTAIY